MHVMPAGELGGSKDGDAGALLVIGVHREELAFGERVAAMLADSGDLPGLELLRIPEGISGRHPRSDQRFHYELQHRAIYRQIRELAGRYRLLIDLHRGSDDEGPCADVICADDRLLACVRKRLAETRDPDIAAGRERIRAVRLAPGGQVATNGAMCGRTVIPSDTWNNGEFLFVGLEVYLSADGVGRQEDWRFSARMIATIVACGRSLAPVAGKDD